MDTKLALNLRTHASKITTIYSKVKNNSLKYWEKRFLSVKIGDVTEKHLSDTMSGLSDLNINNLCTGGCWDISKKSLMNYIE